MIQVICCSSLLSDPGSAGTFSRDFTTSLAPECRAFSGAFKLEKLKAPLIPGPEGAVDTNNWCIKDMKPTVSSHYENTPMQYTAIVHGCKKINFLMKNHNIFSFFALKH